ncbi:hypothetical protein EBU71_15560, partial [bacterium]|nr:hypothetical protein [Candidatus Elulimicrobium humile]
MKKAVVTTFHHEGYIKYGRRMIQTFLENWPNDITLYVYPQDHQITESAPNLVVRDLHSSIPELVAFKEKWRNDPKARGEVALGPPGPKGKTPGLGFRWDAIRFSHKIYSVCHAARNTDADILLWMDADMVCHTPIPHHFIDNLVKGVGLGFLGRERKFTECGLYSMDLRDPVTNKFLVEFQRAYDTGRLFSFSEWNDCWVFDEVRKEIKKFHPDWQWNDWCKGLIKGEGHPLINS